MSDSSASPLITFDYSIRDFEIVDYGNFKLPGIERVLLRGPAPDLSRPWFTALGAAQSQGIYVERPFPQLVAEAIGLSALNMGVGGAWPGFFVDVCPELLGWAARSEFVILQAMSARGGPSSRFIPTERIEMQRDTVLGDTVPSVVAWQRNLAEGIDAAKQYVDELRRAWVEANLRIIERVGRPVVFFWFSKREPEVDPVYSTEGKPFVNMGEFPHFVNQACLDEVAAACVGFVECTSTRNSGHRLVSRFTGEPVELDQAALSAQRRGAGTPGQSAPSEFGLSATHNSYYPSPEMHEDAATAVVKVLRELGLA